MGDVAMLQMLVSRLGKLWPDGSIGVITDKPDLLSVYCPNASPITAQGRRTWFQDRGVFGGQVHRVLPARASFRVLDLEREMRWRWPSLARAVIQFRRKLRWMDSVGLDTYLDALFAADLVAICGGGGITDAFRDFAMTYLDVLAMASRRGIRTVMFGQGFGPIRDPKLLARAKAVLPSVDILCCRESRAGLPLLHSLGVSLDRVMTTGDDAIELAYEARARTLGNGIGVNLRVVGYSEVTLDLLEKIRPVLHDVARKHRASLIPVPIARHDRESDARRIREILAGYDDASDGGQNLKSPLKVIRQVGRCRVVVTGSYHAGVFALSQGIPVVGLAKSAYYVDKFLGLADQFGTGCQTIFLDDEQLGKKLRDAIDVAWSSAEHVRTPLLEAAKRQIELGWNACRRVYELVMANQRGVTKSSGWTVKTATGKLARSTMREKLLIEQPERVEKEHEYPFELVGDSVMTRTLEGRINSWNRGAEKLYGWRKDEAIGKVSHNLLQTQFPKPLKEIEIELARNGRWEGKLVHATRDGSRVVVASHWVLNFTGRPSAVVEISTRSTGS
jgi:colanic acid/amylovoran biosynthesis protein